MVSFLSAKVRKVCSVRQENRTTDCPSHPSGKTEFLSPNSYLPVSLTEGSWLFWTDYTMARPRTARLPSRKMFPLPPTHRQPLRPSLGSAGAHSGRSSCSPSPPKSSPPPWLGNLSGISPYSTALHFRPPVGPASRRKTTHSLHPCSELGAAPHSSSTQQRDFFYLYFFDSFIGV